MSLKRSDAPWVSRWRRASTCMRRSRSWVWPPEYGWVALPEQFQAFNHDYVIIAAIVMYVIEFFADKIPYFDSLWDAIHTAIRPIGGAVIAVTTLGDASPGMKAMAALLGGTIAASSHLTKTSTRAAANTSPEPFSNWILSLGEDVFAVGLGYTALKYPILALAIAVVVLAFIAIFAVAIGTVGPPMVQPTSFFRGDPVRITVAGFFAELAGVAYRVIQGLN